MSLFGADWVAMSASVMALTLLGRKSRWGFVCFMVANLAWIACGLLLPSMPIVLGNMVFLVLNVRGFLAWTPPAQVHDPGHAL
jgi:ABC-type uncharacterized transport system YnjBCD permease subunit